MIRRLVAAVLLVALLGACGVARSGRVQRIDSNELGGLDDTLPTTTSSTTIVPPQTSGPATTLVPTVNVPLYFLTGDQLTPVPTPLATQASHNQVIAALQEGPPPGSIGAGLRNAVPRDAALRPRIIDDLSGVATIDLPPTFFDAVQPTSDQRLAIAQIARTILDRPGIGQVRFTLDGQPTGVPRGNGEIAPPGTTLSKLDFDSLLASTTPTTTTTTTTTTTLAPEPPPPSETAAP